MTINQTYIHLIDHASNKFWGLLGMVGWAGEWDVQGIRSQVGQLHWLNMTLFQHDIIIQH